LPPNAGYYGGAATLMSLTGIVLSYIKCSKEMPHEDKSNPSENEIKSLVMSGGNREQSLQIGSLQSKIPLMEKHSSEISLRTKSKPKNIDSKCISLGNYELPREVLLMIFSYLKPKEGDIVSQFYIS
jgi:hypothetical protein